MIATTTKQAARTSRAHLNGIDEDRQRAIVRDYQNMTMTSDDVMRKHRIGSERLRLILDKFKIPRRKPSEIAKGKRNMAQVFLGMQRSGAVKSDALEAAKQTLRKRGCIVYAAEISDGSKAKGLIRVDNKRLTPAEVIAAAGRK